MNKNRAIIFLILVLIITGMKLNAQEDREHDWSIGGRYHYGFMHPFRMSVRYLVTDHINGIELYAGKKFSGGTYMDQLYRYPEAGIAYYYGTLGNNDVFGRTHALYPYFSAPIYRGGRYSLAYLIGAGVSYNTRIFDVESNNLNILIGSHLNSFIRLAIQNEYELTERLTITNELVVSHYSNGRIKSPNKGLNQVTASVGLKYFMAERVQNEYFEIPELKEKNEFSIVSAYATKVIDQFNTGRYAVISLSFDYSRYVSHIRELTAGLDISYDGSLRRLISDDTGMPAGPADALRIGLHAGQELKFYDVGITMQLGAYLYNKWKKENHFIYQRYGIRYYFSERLFAAAVLKTHLGVADYLSWGVGYNF
ncbi:MAG: acyloxyacyl hydrolase [Bacteroidales bacterium]